MQNAFGFIGTAVAALTLLATAQPTQAAPLTGSFSVTVSEGVTNGATINSTTNPTFTGANAANASFTYTGALNFSNTAMPTTGPASDLNSAFFTNPAAISNYTGSGIVTYNGATVANYSSFGSFLTSSASSAPLQYASYYTFDLGVLAAGTVLSIAHDDGMSLYQGGTRVGNSVTGLTGQVTDAVTITTTADTVLRYTRQNSTPSVLQTSVPEPMSIGLLGMGLAGIGLIRRNKKTA